MRHKTWLPLVVSCLLVAMPVGAEFVSYTYAPVYRLIANTKAFLKRNPDNPEGLYTLGRIHYLAFANEAGQVGVVGVPYGSSSPPDIPPDWLLGDFTDAMRYEHARELAFKEVGYPPSYERVRNIDARLKDQGWSPRKLHRKELLAHASAAAASFKKAISLDPKNALYHLGLASLYKQYLEFAKKAKLTEHPQELKDASLQKTRQTFYTAYELCIKEDLKLTEKPVETLESLVGYEAGKAYVSLAESDPALSDGERQKVAQVKENLKRLDGLPYGGVTPIIFSLQTYGSLSDMLAPGSSVLFDLDGNGTKEYWQWVKPTTGFLVWNPDGKGNIVSGRQMFGSMLWWLFFPNGYRALDALDDNRDGTLSEQELNGIAIWFDRNSNGRCDPGEVVSVQAVGVKALATNATGEDSGSPMNRTGLVMNDGRVLPTYDWIAHPVGSAVTVPLNRDD